MSNTYDRADYRGAIALNNMGVSLLERGAYRNAIDTMKDAIAIMRTIFPQNGAVHSAPHNFNIDSKLQLAAQRLASPETSRAPLSVQTIPFSEDNINAMKDALRYGPSGSVFFPLRIEISDFNCRGRDIDLESSIFLYNFGIAHLCMARVHPKSAAKLRDGALKLFDLAHSILASQCAKAQDPADQTHVLLVAAMVLNNVVQVLSEQGRMEQVGQALSSLKRLDDLVTQIEEDEPDFTSVQYVQTAAAA